MLKTFLYLKADYRYFSYPELNVDTGDAIAAFVRLVRCEVDRTRTTKAGEGAVFKVIPGGLNVYICQPVNSEYS